ncbi:MAG: serine/threonine protein kinase [Myxococcaceae bacterium]|nr:serine/threonine protein kinase [Myxococcaceae bacterium]
MPAARTTSRPMLRASSTVERYAVYDEFAAGGMATVHLARLDGAHGFRRTVAVKRLLPHLARDHDFALMLVDEARLASRIRHHNVVSTLDVVRTDSELLLVMDYVHGEALMKLMRRCAELSEPVPLEIACTILSDALHGLHAAHEAKDERGTSLELVHRDVSPQNILVGADGVTRIADFGVAKAAGRMQTTRDGALKGKLAYMAPEQIESGRVSRQSDLFAASVVLWELLTGARLFQGQNQAETIFKVMSAPIAAPSSRRTGIPASLDALIARGLSRDPSLRFESAQQMALALESAVATVRPATIAAWVERIASEQLAERGRLVRAIELADQDPGEHEAASAHPLRLPTSEAEDSAAVQTQVRTRGSPREKRSRGWLALALVAALALIALASAHGLGLLGTMPARGASVQPVSPNPPPLPAPVVAEREAAAEAPQDAALAPPATAAKVPKSAREPRTRRKRQGEQDPCVPPYAIDKAGRTLFKVECL